MLGEIGISVFRHVGGHSLSETMRTFDELSTDLTTQLRGVGTQKVPAVNLLQLREVQWNKALLGRIAAQEAIDAIFANVPTVRRKLTVQPNGVALFGRKGAAVRPVCLTFNEESAETLVEERDGIRTTLEVMTDADPSSFDWMRDSQPHLALGKINPRVSREKIASLISGLEEICPTELVLCRATLHNPYDNS